MLFNSLNIHAMSLSTYRIYLDDDNSSASFVMFNKNSFSETCRLDLVHNTFDEFGAISSVDSNVEPDNSASPWIRFSPRNFTAAALSPQTVRFTLRRKANSEAEEYRSYLQIYCDEAEAQQPSSTTATPDFIVKPKMVQNIPIIVRTGKLEAQLSFSDFQLVNNKLDFNILRQGNRSVYGKIELIDKISGEVITMRKNISIYPETRIFNYELEVNGGAANRLAVRFTEDERYGGSITYQQDVVLQ
jgi:hypothetical protein